MPIRPSRGLSREHWPSVGRRRGSVARWLRGESLPEEQLEELHLLAESPSAIDVLRAISAMVVGNLPVVICCDQLEAVLQHGDCPEKFANDLVLLLHTVPNLVLVVSCLRDKWDEFLARAPKMFEDRTRQKRLLLSPLSGAQAVEMVQRRLQSWQASQVGRDALWPFSRESVKRWADQMTPGPRAVCCRNRQWHLSDGSTTATKMRSLRWTARLRSKIRLRISSAASGTKS